MFQLRDRIRRTRVVVEAESIAVIGRVDEHSVVELDPGAVSHPYEPVEDGGGGRGLRQTVRPDGSRQCFASGYERRVVGPCSVANRSGEGAQFGTGRDTAARGIVSIENSIEIDLETLGFAARTEQRQMGRRSIEALVKSRDPRCDELDLGSAEGTVPSEGHELGAA